MSSKKLRRMKSLKPSLFPLEGFRLYCETMLTDAFQSNGPAILN